MENIINLQTKLQTAQVANNRLNEVYLVASEFEEKKTVEDLSLMKGDMTFKQVSYKYGYGRDVLSDINLTIPQGSKVAFVGISGSGKTTLAKMMVNFYDPSQGEISLGGVNLNQIDKKALRQYINYLPQQPMSLTERFWTIFFWEPRKGRLKRISYGRSNWQRFGRISSGCH